MRMGSASQPTARGGGGAAMVADAAARVLSMAPVRGAAATAVAATEGGAPTLPPSRV